MEMKKYLLMVFCVLLTRLTLYGQASLYITEDVTWTTDKSFNTHVVVEDGATLTIVAGVYVGFEWVDLNLDGIGDLELLIKQGGTLKVFGTPASPVIFGPSGDPAPPGSENMHWRRIYFEASSPSYDTLCYFIIRNASEGLTLTRNLLLKGMQAENIAGIPFVINNFNSNEPLYITSLTITNPGGQGLQINNPNTHLSYVSITGTDDYGLYLNAPNIFIDNCEISGINGTGIFNGPNATNTLIENSSIFNCAKSGIFNLDGKINRIQNTLVYANGYHGIVNSSGYVWVQQSEIKDNDSLGILLAGASESNITYVSVTGNVGYGVDLKAIKLTEDLKIPAGNSEPPIIATTFNNSNIHSNDIATNIQVNSSAPSSPQANFRQNWWGQQTGVADLVQFVNINSIDYSNWIFNGTVQNTLTNLSKSLTIYSPDNASPFNIGNDVTIKWITTGFVPMVEVTITDDFGNINNTYSQVLSNTGEYTFTGDATTTRVFLESYPDGAVIANGLVIFPLSYLALSQPQNGELILGGSDYLIEWEAPAGETVTLLYTTDADLPFNEMVWEVIPGGESIPSETAELLWEVPNDIVAPFALMRITDDNNGLADGFSGVFSIRPAPPTTTGSLWAYNGNTGHNMTVLFEDVILLDADDDPILNTEDDMYIGAFYVNTSGNLVCVGSQYLGYDPLQASNPVLLTIWGDDPTTSGVIEGVPEGKSLIFKIWRIGWSAIDDPEETTYPGDIFDRNANPSTNLLYHLNDDKVVANLKYQRSSNEPPVVTEVEQVVTLRNGWSYISSYADPGTNKTLSFSSVLINDNLLTAPKPVSQGGINQGIYPSPGSFVMLKNDDGNVYWVTDNSNPASPVITANLTQWDYREGYYMLMESTQTNYLRVVGTEILPQSVPLSLRQGWNMVPYLRKTAMPTQLALATILDQLEIVKDQDGNVYWPSQSITSLSTLNPGSAYMIKLNSADVLLYPANTGTEKPSGAPSNPVAGIYSVNFNSSKNAVIAFPASKISAFVSTGDEIGVFNKEGILSGSAVFNGNSTAVTVWGKDINTGNAGLSDGEEFTIRVVSAETGEEKTLQNLAFSFGENIFTTNGMSIFSDAVAAGDIIPAAFTVSPNYPNPFNPSTRVDLSLPVDSRVSVTIFNSLGQKVQQIDAGQLSAGYHHINFDMAGFSSGVYYYHILAGENNYSGRMMLLK